jgi:gamma-glutamylcyclotransferase (GGCT)/AIG2-like uncharacterized protein YtfP
MLLLFSYGTLQDPSVQASLFGRHLHGEADELVGFERSLHHSNDKGFVATSGQDVHAIVRFTGDERSLVPGTVFEVSDEELEKADRYEPAGYRRVSTVLRSGRQAWVYAGDES